MKIVTGLLIVAILAMVGFIGMSLIRPPAPANKPVLAEVSTMPPGVTFTTVGAVQAMTAMGAFMGYDVIADAKNMTLYTSDKDAAGKSLCVADCAKSWLPFQAPAEAKSSGFWQVVARDDGSKQWAFHGKPLYTYAEDKKAGDFKGNSVDGWHFVLNQAMAGVPLPDGISTTEIVAGGGQAFVNVHAHTIYVYAGDLKSDTSSCPPGAECVNHWQPLLAGELAHNLGDFSVIRRPDGARQWAYQAQPLYTFDGDIEKGDANGRNADPRWQVALAERYFQPPNIRFGKSVRGMDMLTDANGMTIYARDRQMYQVGGFNLRGGQHGIPLMGKALGALTCPADCAKIYPPVFAADDAQPAGYWSLAKRADGKKQWSYQGYALYTYTGDKKPGDETSHDEFDLSLGQILPPTPSPIDAVSALYWREVNP